MQRLSLDKIIEKIKDIPENDCDIILIEDDLTEGFYKKSKIIDDIENIVQNNIGFCFIKSNSKYFFWKYDPLYDNFIFVEKSGTLKLFPHDKLSSKFDFIMINKEKMYK